jgi:hypothetical protein
MRQLGSSARAPFGFVVDQANRDGAGVRITLRHHAGWESGKPPEHRLSQQPDQCMAAMNDGTGTVHDADAAGLRRAVDPGMVGHLGASLGYDRQAHPEGQPVRRLRRRPAPAGPPSRPCPM